jgi:N6-L-threonylcarbamoyladenine synthase
MAALYSGGAPKEVCGSEFLAFHVSGGTTEAVVAHPREGGFDVELIGYGADLHAGQVIDRVGVMMGLDFPCGRAMEQLAVQNTDPLPQVKTCVREGICNLSGLENQAAALWKKTGNAPLVSAYVLTTIGKTLRKMTDQLQAMRAERGEPILPVVYAGGVMSNKFIRPMLTKGAGWRAYFSEPAFSADNAAGTSILCALEAQ